MEFLSGGPFDIDAKMKMFWELLNHQGKTICDNYYKNKEIFCFKTVPIGRCRGLGNPKTLANPRLKEGVQDLKITCALDITVPKRDLLVKKPKLNEELGKFYLQGDLPDVTLVCMKRKFQCHKLILSARSQVFRAMLESTEMKEVIENQVEIEDMDPDVLEQFLEFAYHDEIIKAPLPLEQMLELLKASDRYDFQSLKRECEERIAQTITVGDSMGVAVRF